MTNQEQERLKWLRDRQLSARDPTARRVEYQRLSLARDKASYRRLTLAGVVSDIPSIWKGAVVSALLGLLLVYVITSLWDTLLGWVVSLGIFIFLLIIGMLVGNAFDVKKRIKENL